MSGYHPSIIQIEEVLYRGSVPLPCRNCDHFISQGDRYNIIQLREREPSRLDPKLSPLCDNCALEYASTIVISLPIDIREPNGILNRYLIEIDREGSTHILQEDDSHHSFGGGFSFASPDHAIEALVSLLRILNFVADNADGSNPSPNTGPKT
jgi:hypothetical protein